MLQTMHLLRVIYSLVCFCLLAPVFEVRLPAPGDDGCRIMNIFYSHAGVVLKWPC